MVDGIRTGMSCSLDEAQGTDGRQHMRMSYPGGLDSVGGHHEPGCQTADFSTLMIKCGSPKMPAHRGFDEVKQSRCSTCACSADRSRGSYVDVEWLTVLPCRAHSALRSPNSATHCTKLKHLPGQQQTPGGRQLRAAPVHLVLMQSGGICHPLSRIIRLSPTSACACHPASILQPSPRHRSQGSLALRMRAPTPTVRTVQTELSSVLFPVIRPRDRTPE